MHRVGERLETFRRRVDQEEMRVGIERGAHGRSHLRRRLHRDPLQTEVGLQRTREWRGIVKPELRAGKRVRTCLEDDALIGAHRRVAGVVLDLHEGNVDLRLARRRVLRGPGRITTNCRERKEEERQDNPAPAGSLPRGGAGSRRPAARDGAMDFAACHPMETLAVDLYPGSSFP